MREYVSNRLSSSDYLMHRHHKYIYRKKVNGKWRYYYKPNKWEINSSNYEQKRKEIAKEAEWQDIVKRKDPEYMYTDENGKTQFNIDKYMVNKKHPVIDALTDYGEGRKVTTLKQDSETFVAGAKDYVEMGRRTVENVMTLGVGILTAKIKNQQGSYDKKKAEMRKEAQTASKMAKSTLDNYDKASSSVSNISEDDLVRAATIGEAYLKKYMR